MVDIPEVGYFVTIEPIKGESFKAKVVHVSKNSDADDFEHIANVFVETIEHSTFPTPLAFIVGIEYDEKEKKEYLAFYDSNGIPCYDFQY